jgi:hypothetical protein
MFKRYLAIAGATAALALIVPTAAMADDCANLSRSPAACGMTCIAPVIDGNWVWLPSIGIPEPAWGFGTPGSIPSVEAGLPGANGNYLNSSTDSATWLLENTPMCNGGNAARQTMHGIQTGCGEG